MTNVSSKARRWWAGTDPLIIALEPPAPGEKTPAVVVEGPGASRESSPGAGSGGDPLL